MPERQSDAHRLAQIRAELAKIVCGTTKEQCDIMLTRPIMATELVSEYRERRREAPMTSLVPLRLNQRYVSAMLRTEAPIDVYNITAPFLAPNEDGDEETYIAGRVEARDSEDSRVMFFKYNKGEYRADLAAPILPMQDPFVTTVDNDLVVGGVVTYQDGPRLGYKTRFYAGPSLDSLEPFAEGPDGEKDIRIIQLEDRIGIFRRPQGQLGGRGKIAYQEAPELSGLNRALKTPLTPADLLQPNFDDQTHGGANELHPLADGRIGVLGHVAHKRNEDTPDETLHYYPMAFKFNPRTRESTPMRILAEAAEFPQKDPKHPRLNDVVFTGGLGSFDGQSAILYCGLKDSYAAAKLIPDPFR